MSKKDRETLLNVISNYLGMWSDADPEVLDSMKEEFDEIDKVEKKIRNIHKSKSYNNAVIKDALEIAERLKKESKI
jgi:hypothetical protein